ncbi:MAG: hypothetical protein HRT88_09065 [Lentisphaeraceae bacterium]|nr:hypothetical protein [Lentisphaeraceae bacterium]
MRKMMYLFLSFWLVCSGVLMDEGQGKGGDGFRQAAVKYDSKAKQAFSKGQAELGKCFRRLAAIKRHAAKLGDANKWKDIDWSEYEKLSAKDEELKSVAAKAGKEKKK